MSSFVVEPPAEGGEQEFVGNVDPVTQEDYEDMQNLQEIENVRIVTYSLQLTLYWI